MADPIHQYQLVARGYRLERLASAGAVAGAADADGAADDDDGASPPAASEAPLLYRRDRDGGLVALWSGPHGQRVALVRVDGPARRARRDDSNFIRRFERGLERGLRGIRRKRTRVGKVGPVPVLDVQLEYIDAEGARIWSATRTLFLKPYALTLAVTAPAGAPARRARRQVRRLMRSFRPYTGS